MSSLLAKPVLFSRVVALSASCRAKRKSLFMAPRKRKAITTLSQASYDSSRFVSRDAWDRYADNILGRNILLKRNVKLYINEFDDFRREELTKEFYANLYVFEDKEPKQVRVRGHLIKFDAESLNTFLKTPVVLEQGERLPSYSRFCRLRPDPQELAARMCIPGRGFLLNTEGLPWKLFRKDLTTMAQTWSVLSYSNLAPTSHTSDLNLDRARLVYGLVMKMDLNIGALISGQISLIAQSNSSRLGFLSHIIALCKARGVTSDSLTYESLILAINLAYIKKNCWNLDDPLITFPRTQKSKARRFEAPSPSAAPAPPTSAPSTSALPSALAAPVLPAATIKISIVMYVHYDFIGTSLQALSASSCTKRGHPDDTLSHDISLSAIKSFLSGKTKRFFCALSVPHLLNARIINATVTVRLCAKCNSRANNVVLSLLGHNYGLESSYCLDKRISFWIFDECAKLLLCA
ncbi:hypothetical protein HKD37_04G010402 [Glycine soja]